MVSQQYIRPPGHNQSETDHITGTFDSIFKNIRHGLLGVLFILNKDRAGGNWFICGAEALIDHFQDLYFPLGFKGFEWQPEASWLITALSWFSPEKFVSGTFALYILLITILGLVLLNALWVGYCFAKNRFRFMWTLKFLRFTLRIFSTILYIPILDKFVHSVAECPPTGDHIAITWRDCWAPPYLGQSVATLIVLVIFVCLVLSVSATYFDVDPDKKSVLARPHSRLELLYLTCRTVLTIANTILVTYGNKDGTLERWIMALVCIATSGVLVLTYCWYIPYYNFRFSIFRAGLQAVFFWASLSAVFNLARPKSDIGILFLILMPVMFLLAVLLVKARRRAIESADPVKADVLTLELMVRFKLESAGLLFKDPPKNNVTLLAVSPGDLTRSTSSPPLGKDERKEHKERDLHVLDEANKLYAIGLKQHQHSCLLQLFASQFALLRLGNKAQCMAALSKAEHCHPYLDEASLIFRRQRQLSERFSGGDQISMIDFIAYEQSINSAKKWQRRAEAAVIQFWAELLRSRPSFRRLHVNGAAVTTAISAAQQHFAAMLKLAPTSPQVYRMYADFLFNVLNDHKHAQDMVQRADELEGERSRSTERLNEADDEYSLVSENNMAYFADSALVTISGELDSLGQILSANAQWLKLFGLKRYEAIHHNITVIIPSPFAEVHDGLLRRYLDTGYAKVIDRPRQVLAVDSAGFLILVTLCVKQVMTSEGGASKTTFLGIMGPVPPKLGEGFVILDDSLRILHCSQDLMEVFHPERVRGATLDSWAPHLTLDALSQLTSKEGISQVLDTGPIAYKLHFRADQVGVLEEVCYICRVKYSVIKPAKSSSLSPSSSQIQSPSLPPSSPQHPSSPKVTPQGSRQTQFKLSPEESDNLQVPIQPGRCPFGYDDKPEPQIDILGDEELTPAVPMTPELGPMISVTSATSSASAIPMSFSPHASADCVARPNTEAPKDKRKGSRVNIVAPAIAKTPPHSDDDDRRSVGSLGSRTSTKDNYIRRVVTVKNMQTNRQLLWLRNAFLVCLLILGILAVVDNVTYKALYNQVESRLRQVVTVGKTSSRLMDVIDSTRSMEIAEDATITASISNKTHAVLRLKYDVAFLLVTATEFASIAPGSAPYADVNMYVSNGSGGWKRSSTVGLFDAIQDVVSDVLYLVDTPQATINSALQRKALDNIYVNAAGPILTAINASIVDSTEQFRELVNHKRKSHMANSAIGPAVCLVCLMIIWPLYVNILTSRSRFYSIFLDIPKEVVKGIYSAHMQRLADADSDADDDDDVADPTRLLVDNLLQNESESNDMEAQSDVTDLNNSKWRFWGKIQDQHRMTIKALMLFGACAAYFFSASGWTFTFISNHFDLPTEVYWTEQLSAIGQAASYRLREDVLRAYGYIDASSSAVDADPETPLPSTSSLLALSENVAKGLMYGSASMMTRATADTKDDKVRHIFLQDACIPGMPEDCATFADGLFKRGLYAALGHNVRFAHNLYEEVANTVAPPTPAPLPPIIVSQLTTISALATNYLPRPLDYSIEERLAFAKQQLAWFRTFHLAFTIIFCLTLALLYAAVYRPLLMKLREDTRRTYVMLFMIPPEILSKMPSIKRWASMSGTKADRTRRADSIHRRPSMMPA
ncbi:hypothetical protein HDU85_004984 [Gaertneriomyces sp. JEL0708]|nr:hypothetical protein HDU85_004984 [Gaertneriomyces sp. JEL0708]